MHYLFSVWNSSFVISQARYGILRDLHKDDAKFETPIHVYCQDKLHNGNFVGNIHIAHNSTNNKHHASETSTEFTFVPNKLESDDQNQPKAVANKFKKSRF